MTDTILRVLVGSRAHGLATPESDFDYREVFVVPTQDFFRIPPSPRLKSWAEGKGEDTTGFEVGHFLSLAVQSKPNVMEMFAGIVEYPPAPEPGETKYPGMKLLELFPHVWSSKDVYTAFRGYSHNQHKKLFDESEAHVSRRWKYATAYIRVLMLGEELLRTGSMSLEVPENMRAFLLSVKEGHVSVGAVIEVAEEWKEKLAVAYRHNPDKQTNYEPVNEYLLAVRQAWWEG